MSYFIADSTGPLADFASIGGLADFRNWALTQSAPIRQFVRFGFTEDLDDLVAELEKVEAPGKVDEQRRLLIENGRKAKNILILSDGTSDVDLRSAARVVKHPPNEVHAAADKHYGSLKTAIKFAFARGRTVVDKEKLSSASTPADYIDATRFVQEEIRKTLVQVLPGTLAATLNAGGDAGLLLLGKKLRAAGGKGSGHFGHSGRPGEIGGSGPSPANDRGDETDSQRSARKMADTIAKSPKKSGEMPVRMIAQLAKPGELKQLRKTKGREIEQVRQEIMGRGYLNSRPIILRPTGWGGYQVEDGHKRIIAAMELKMEKLPVIIGELGDKSDPLVPTIRGRRRRILEMRAAEPKFPKFKVRFDVVNPNAINWIRKHTLELASDLSKTTKKNIASALEDAFSEGDLDGLYDAILDAVGDDARADVIARTESMIAANEGQRQSWDQAVEMGLLDGTERKTWIATDDKNLCPACEALDGKTTTLDGQYPDDGGDGPPLHPNCRCTEGII